MAEDDIYRSKQKYENVVKKINNSDYLKKDLGWKSGRKGQYYIKNADNIKYFKKLINQFETDDISYIRRIKYIDALRKTANATNKDFKDLTKDDVKRIIAKYNQVHKTINSRRDFVNYNKFAWKVFLPELDEKGRPDETITPYVWRIKVHNDPSLKKDRKDRLTIDEYSQIINSLSNDIRMQSFFSIIYESLARPQELCWVNYGDVELFDNYARIRIKAHGKEGTKSLQIVENYQYLADWLNKHPTKKKDDPLFILLGNNSKNKRMTPNWSGKILNNTLDNLKIDRSKCYNYSFKRNGITDKILNRESGVFIQKTAGWSSQNQLKTYDLSTQDEVFEQQLIKAGIKIPENREQEKIITTKHCFFCNTINPKSNEVCYKCKRPLDREKILQQEQDKNNEMDVLRKEMQELKAMVLEAWKKREI